MPHCNIFSLSFAFAISCHMRINASSAHEASKQILRVVLTSDYHHAYYRGNSYGYIYVYFDVERCKYFFDSIQRNNSIQPLKRYRVLDVEEVLKITATKYKFSQIAIGAINHRKLMTHREFFEITKEHFVWV